MMLEPSFQAALDIFFHPESANSDAAEALRLTGCTHQLIATPVGQTDISDKYVKRFAIEQFLASATVAAVRTQNPSLVRMEESTRRVSAWSSTRSTRRSTDGLAAGVS